MAVEKKRKRVNHGAPLRSGTSASGEANTHAKVSRLSDEIADLLNPAPTDFDPESIDPFEDGAAATRRRVSGGLDDTGDDDVSSAAMNNEPNGRLRLRGNIVLDSKKYGVKRASRAELEREGAEEDDDAANDDDADNDANLDDDDDDEDGDDLDGGLEDGSLDDDGDDDEGIEDSDDENEDEDEDEDEDEGKKPSRSGRRMGKELENGDADSDEDVDSISDDESGSELDDEQAQDDNDELERQIQELRQEDQAALVGLSVDTKAEYEKARHTRNQRALVDAFLDLRIRMQKALSTANRFPQAETYPAFATTGGDLGQALQDASAAASSLLSDLLTLRKELADQNPAVPKPSIPTDESEEDERPSKDQPGRLWAELTALHDSFVPFRNEVIDKWNRKTQLASGAGGAGTKFKALNQTILTQVERLTADISRLVRKTQLKRSVYRIIGKPDMPTTNEASATTPDSVATTDASKRRDEHLQDYDEEIFDDSDFYQQLLRDVIESGSAAVTADSNPREWTHQFLALRALRTKTKKAGVDPKASKGRKIRFDVHAKLVNFMAPVPVPENAVTEELLSSLFGQTATQTRFEFTPDDPPLLSSYYPT